MALLPTALLTIEEARAAIFGPANVQDGTHDTSLETLVNAATALAETVYCGRPLRARVFADVRVAGPCHTRLYPLIAEGDQPLAGPIDATAPVTITVNGTLQTVWTSEVDGDPAAKNVEVYRDHFYRASGWGAGDGRRRVLLTFTGGFEPVPADLVAAAQELMQKLWPVHIEGRLDLASHSGPAGSQQTIEGAVGGAGVDIWDLSPRTRRVFESYKLRWIV